MIGKESRRASFVNQILLILIGTLLLYLVVNFGRQVAVSYQRHQELGQVQSQISAAQSRTQELQEYLDYALSDGAAEAWARQQGWAKPGEVPVLIVASSTGGSSATQTQPAQADSPASYQQSWWELFFGTR
jgi:type II secretory pathway pseudopilin PulG